ncbi:MULTISPECIES: hypothetical protein [Spirulina sp. CCY15215]|uniref:hypothetical protein n=1 Tax=Spirulina sp. CCY15215 TaxID=2767591 RepID=UPI0019506CA4|nr:hypothetical protein [Spirulina major]
MDIEGQLQILIERSPDDGMTVQIIENAVVPTLRAFSEQLKQLEYYVIQTLEQGWVLTTLSNRARAGVEKKVIYGFASLKDASNFQDTSDPNLVAIALPVTHILFQLFALKEVDSIVFMETPGNLSAGKEVRRSDLQKLVEVQWQDWQKSSRPKSRTIPPDLA